MSVSFLKAPKWGFYLALLQPLPTVGAVEAVGVDLEVTLEMDLEAVAEVEEATNLSVLGRCPFVRLKRWEQGLARSDGIDGRDGRRGGSAMRMTRALAHPRTSRGIVDAVTRRELVRNSRV
jgi:hypothetical protein